MTLEKPPPERVRWPEFSTVIFDCDSTLTAVEGIDILAESLGLHAEVASMTDAAMAGEIDLGDIYAARLTMLHPSKQSIGELRRAYKRNAVPDAADTVAALRELGVAVFVVSGGLAEPVAEFAVHLGIDASNVRAVAARHDSLSGEWWKAGQQPVDEAYTGFEAGALTRSDGKAEVIAELLHDRKGLSMLVGDGASDLSAAPAVDLFVGYGGVASRPHVVAGAPVFIHSSSLAPVVALAAGPGGRQRLMTTASKEVLAKGIRLVETGDVSFSDPAKRTQLMAALEMETRHLG